MKEIKCINCAQNDFEQIRKNIFKCTYCGSLYEFEPEKQKYKQLQPDSSAGWVRVKKYSVLPDYVLKEGTYFSDPLHKIAEYMKTQNAVPK